MTAPEPLLEVQDLMVEFPRGAAVAGTSFDVRPGEILGLMGESGAGKTMTALSILRLIPSPGRITGGRILWRGRNLLGFSQAELRATRGREIAMIFQDPAAALHPMLRVDAQVAEAIRAHAPGTSRREALDRATDALVGLGVPLARVRQAPFPHQWSGGMCQRAMLAMAVVNRPSLLVADEPTTALDGITQARVLGILERLRNESKTAILLITHDLSVIAEAADRVAIMRDGRVVEIGEVARVFDEPQHPYTAHLVEQSRRPALRIPRLTGGIPALSADNVQVRYRARSGRDSEAVAVDDVSLAVAAGETLGLVGESGAGKSSLARAIIRLTDCEHGTVRVAGADLMAMRGEELRRTRADIQIVFQNPYASLNPRRTVGANVAEPLRIHDRFGADGASRVTRALESVGLSAGHARRLPRQLSGGERQRAAIARALVLSPRILILDEPVSSLDAPTRQGILSLLIELQSEHDMAYLFISHDLEVIRAMSHRIAVMYRGRIVETGTAENIMLRPHHPYTRALVASQPARHPRDRGRLIGVAAAEEDYRRAGRDSNR